MSIADSGAGRTRVLLIFGGRSSEHAISCVSAVGILKALDRERYDVTAAGILPDGRWVEVEADPAALPGVLPTVPDTGSRIALLPEPATEVAEPGTQVAEPGTQVAEPATQIAVESAEPPRVLADVDVVFPVLHGPWGEDGTLQGLLELAGVPYVGSGVFASAAAMDKGHLKALLGQAGLPMGDYAVLAAGEWDRDPAAARARVQRLGFPLFVKPARAGSSVGITRITGPDGLEAAIRTAEASDPRVVVEAAVLGAREVECGVLADVDGTPRASLCAEIRVGAGHEFYDFEAKYLDDAAELIVPADLEPHILERVQQLAVRCFEVLTCEGLARVDFFIRGEDVLVNEVNTMPGFTPISMFPRMWAASGVDYPTLVDRLIQDALRRGTGLR